MTDTEGGGRRRGDRFCDHAFDGARPRDRPGVCSVQREAGAWRD